MYTFQRYYSYPCYCCSQRQEPHTNYTIIGIYSSLEEIIKNKEEIYKWHKSGDGNELNTDEEREYTITKFKINTRDDGEVIYKGENIYSTIIKIKEIVGTIDESEDDSHEDNEIFLYPDEYFGELLMCEDEYSEAVRECTENIKSYVKNIKLVDYKFEKLDWMVMVSSNWDIGGIIKIKFWYSGDKGGNQDYKWSVKSPSFEFTGKLEYIDNIEDAVNLNIPKKVISKLGLSQQETEYIVGCMFCRTFKEMF